MGLLPTGISCFAVVNVKGLSLVPFPANLSARVTRVKEMLREAGTERKFEKALRELGLSKSDAQYITSLAKPSLRDLESGSDKEGGDAELILGALQEINTRLLI